MEGPKITDVQIQDTATQAAAPAPAAPAPSPFGVDYVFDSRGRKIGLKKLKPSERFLLSKHIETPNLSTLMQAITVASIISIDLDGFPPLKNEADLLSRLDLIGDDGLEAVTEKVMKMYGQTLTPAEATTAKN